MRAGGTFEHVKRKGGEFRVTLPNGVRLNGSARKKTVGAAFLAAARKAGVEL